MQENRQGVAGKWSQAAGFSRLCSSYWTTTIGAQSASGDSSQWPENIQQYLLNYYASSTFNICEHQALPLMEGSPMRQMVDT